MAFENENHELIKIIDKNQRGDKILIDKITNKDSGEFIGVDIRQYYTVNDELHPTKKGLRIPAELFNEVLEGITSILTN